MRVAGRDISIYVVPFAGLGRGTSHEQGAAQAGSLASMVRSRAGPGRVGWTTRFSLGLSRKPSLDHHVTLSDVCDAATWLQGMAI